jgi:hypothetical protein
MATNFVPSREAELSDFSRNFDTKITAEPTAYGLSAPQAAAYTTLHDTWISAYELVQDPVTKSPANVLAKNNAKDALVDGPGGIRELARIVQSAPGVTNVQKLQLRLTVRDEEPTPIPVPTTAPALEIVSNVGRTVTIRLHDPSTPERRARPEGVQGATIFTYVGEENPPLDVTAWKFEGSMTKVNDIAIDFPLTVADGAKVWITAFWYNPRAQSGPPCAPVSTRLIGGLAKAA